MMIKTYLAATIGAVLAFAPANADAATLSGSSSGTFTSEDAGFTCTAAFFVCIGGVDGATIDTLTIEWPGDTFGFNSSNPPRSSLTINDENFTYTPTLGAGVYKVGSLTWSNAASPANITPDEFSATAVIELAFNQPTNQTGQQSVSFDITNTGNPNFDDEIALQLGDFDFGFDTPFFLGNGLTLTGFSTSLDDDFWSVAEGGTSTLDINANISAVPLPASALLLLGGLGGLGGASALRRRRKAA